MSPHRDAPKPPPAYARAALGDLETPPHSRVSLRSALTYAAPQRTQRHCLRRKPEQIRPQLVMKLGGDLPALLVLNVDEAAGQHEILVSGVLEMGGQRVEPLGHDLNLPHRRTGQANLVMAALEIAQALGET